MVAFMLGDNVESTLFGLFVALLLFPFILFAVFGEDKESPMSENVNIEICGDCAMMSANGSHGWEYDESWLHAYVATAERLGDPILTCHESEACMWFSMSPCDFCGSTLGGYRHPAVLGLA